MDKIENLDSILAEITDESVSAVHHSLRATRRRLVVVLIAYQALPESFPADIEDYPPREATGDEKTITVRELARAIASLEEDVSEEHATGQPYRNVYNALVQTHLPRLEEVSAVQFDADRKTVRPGKNLVALAAIASITSPLAQQLFHAAIATLYSGGSVSPEPSISD